MGSFGVIIDWIKPFSFLLDSKVIEQVNNSSLNSSTGKQSFITEGV